MITHFSVLRAVIAAMSLVCLAGQLIAQSPRVYRDAVEPNWFSNQDRFWYRIKTSADEFEFVVVDTKAATRMPAFDHNRLAAALTVATSNQVAAGRLPIEQLTFDKDNLHVQISGKQGAWNVDLSTYSVSKISPANSKQEVTPLFLPARKSIDRGGDTEFRVTNQLAMSVELVWIGRDNVPVLYHKIAAGKSVSQHTFFGHVWLVKLPNGKDLAAFEVSESTDEVVIDAQAIDAAKPNSAASPKRSRRRAVTDSSADGAHTAFVRDENLWISKVYGDSTLPREAGEIQLTSDATAGNTFQKDSSRQRLVEMQYALPDPPVTEPDVRWSPDSRYVLAFQTQKVAERRVWYIDSTPKNQKQPVLESYPYAKPGDPLPLARPRLFTTEGWQEILIANELFSNPFKLQFLKWSRDSQHFYMLYNQRGHQSLRVLEVSATDGSVRAIVDESSETFIHYSDEGKFVLEWLPENRLLWASERSGWNHLYVYDLVSGEVQNVVTTGDWNVKRIEHIDRQAGVIWFYAVGVASEQDPYHEHFCRINFDGTGLQVLTKGDGTHAVTMSPDRRFFLDRYSRVDMAPVTELRRSSDGSLVTLLETADASELLEIRGSLPIRFTAKARDGVTDIWGIIHLPRYFVSGRQYPVVENIYAGPHDHHVPKAFRASYRHQQEIADRGMVVVQIDGMGTAWRSKRFHDVCFRNLKDAGFPDRIEWLKAAAAKYPFMDVSRVGVYGGSAGGQNAMGALLWHGTFYKVAVADCGCHDNRMDKLWWNEQWMGWPVGDHYATNSNVENAHLLQGKLMLVVGELDRNVDPASTTQAVAGLMKAGKDFTHLLIPGAGHGACERTYGSRRRADFLAKHLRAVAEDDRANTGAEE